MRIAAIDGGLMFGQGTFYSVTPNQPNVLRREKCRSDLEQVLQQRKRKDVTSKCSPEGKRCTLGRDCEESLVLQYLKLQMEPQVGYCFSRWHSGLGSLSFGSHFRQQVDLTCIERAMIEETDALPHDTIEYDHRFHMPKDMTLKDFVASSASVKMPLWRQQQLEYRGKTMKPFKDVRNPLQRWKRRVDELNTREQERVPMVPEFDVNGWGRVPGVPTNVNWNSEAAAAAAERPEYQNFFQPAYMTKITLIQYHGCFWHNGGHYERCVHYKPQQQQQQSNKIQMRSEYSRYLDKLKLYYGGFMQEAAQVWIETRIVYSCDIMCYPGSWPTSWSELEARSKMKRHQLCDDLQLQRRDIVLQQAPVRQPGEEGAHVKRPPTAMREEQTRVQRQGQEAREESLRDFLRRKFYHETCLGFSHSKKGNDVGDVIGGETIRVDNFKDWIATSPYTACSISSLEHVHPREKIKSHILNDTGGFVTIIGGKMKSNDNSFGYCHLRATTSYESLGDFSKYQLQLMGREQQHFLKSTMKKEAKTMTRQTFSETEPEVLNMDYLRYLVQEHGLHDYTVLHIYLFRAQANLNDFLVSLLKLRAACKQTSEILSHSLKLCINR